MSIITFLKKDYRLIFWWFFGVAFLLFFVDPLNRVLNRVIVDPLISGFKNTAINSVVLLILSIIICVGLWLYASKEFLWRTGFITIFLYVLFITSNFWALYYSTLIPFFRDWDFIVLGLTIPCIRTIIPQQITQDEESENKGFVEDLAVEDDGSDSFKRKILANEIARLISITPNKKAFAIGILGEYGSGKTSFLNLIKKNLDKKSTEVIDFNPWSAEGSSNIQKDYFDLLASKLYELNPQISSLIIDYSRKLARVDSSTGTFIKRIGFAGNLFRQRNYNDDYERINSLLKDCGKKVVVAIDDVDRLYNEEVLEVLRLIRNTGNFTNIFYLVAYVEIPLKLTT